jgi:hypothetical protein
MPAPIFPPVPASRHAAFRHFDAATWTMIGLFAGRPLIWKILATAFFVQRIGGQAINRFRRQRHDFAGAQQFRRAFHGGGKKRGVCVDRISAVTRYS